MIALIISICCLALNAFFVAAEFAMVKVRATQLSPLARRGDRRAVAAEAVLSQLDRYLSVTQVGITIASLGLGWIGEPAVEALANRIAIALTGHGLGTVGEAIVDVLGLATLTFLHVLLGELVPKAIAIRSSESTALATSIPLRIINIVFWPILWVMERAQRAVLRLLRIDPSVTEGELNEEEILGILTTRSGANDPPERDKRRTLERVVRFASRPIRQIMIPRVDVTALPIDSSGEHAYALLKSHAFSRVLVYRDSIDCVVGYLYAKDFLLDEHARTRRSIEDLVRRTVFVPESADGLAALRKMQRAHVPLAVVVDEYGGTSGIVTIEDLVEEVFGDIRDELDIEAEPIVLVEERQTTTGDVCEVWDVDARTTSHDLKAAGISLVDEPGSEDNDTIGKLVLRRLGHLPHTGDVVAFANGVRAEILRMTGRRIRRLRVRTP